MAAPITLTRRFERKWPRLVKGARQRLRMLTSGGRPDTKMVFVIGAQRSGTRLPLQILDCSADVSTFTEGSAPFFDGVLLEPLDRVEQLRRRSTAAILALKPICETHRVHELLDRFPGSKAIWIMRNFEDTVNSASVKWQAGRVALGRLASGDLRAASWRAGGLTPEKLALVRRLYREDMSEHEANAVMWYLRNDLFFDLHADTRQDVLLVLYEDLVANPQQHVTRLFNFIGMPLPPGVVAVIGQRSRPKRAFPGISAEIRTLCEGLEKRLMAHYTLTLGAPVAPGAAPGAVVARP